MAKKKGLSAEEQKLPKHLRPSTLKKYEVEAKLATRRSDPDKRHSRVPRQVSL